VDRELGADLEDLERLVRPEDVVHDDHARPVPHAHADRGIGALRQPLGRHQRASAQFVEVEVGVAKLEQAGPELVLAGLAVLLDEAVDLQRLQQPVHGGRRELQPLGQLGHAEAPGAARQRLEDAGGAVDRLDARGPAGAPIRLRHCRMTFDALG
jgi:hypothetical protein